MLQRYGLGLGGCQPQGALGGRFAGQRCLVDPGCQDREGHPQAFEQLAAVGGS
jgi:hypothetical protein